MPRNPVRFDFRGELLPAQAEAASRRRLRLLENTYPAVRGWQVAVEVPQRADGERARAHVAATIVGGDTFEADGSGADALAALRLAFNGLEEYLQEESDRARERATHWLDKVRTRYGRAWLHAG